MEGEAPTFISNSSGAGPSATAVLDIVFVHGLSGDRYKTWSETDEGFWLRWLADRFPDCNLYTAGFETDVFYSRLTGPGASFQDLATTLADGIACRVSPAPRLLLVTHSLGGLIVKQMIRRCSDTANPAFNKLVRSVRGVIFFGTPHQGTALATALDVILSGYKSKAVKQLAYGNDTLIDLHEFFRNWATKHNVAVKPFYETMKTWGTQIVDSISANPHVYGAEPVAVQADHVSICKPKTQESFVYQSVVAFITMILEGYSNGPATAAGQIALVPIKSSTPLPALALPKPTVPPNNMPSGINWGEFRVQSLAKETQVAEELSSEGLAPDVLVDYEFYTTTADGDRRDLASKLADAGRLYQVKDAERKKERFSMALRRHIAQPAAMTRYTKLMADVETRFRRHIDRLIASGATPAAIDNAIQTSVIDPCTAAHSTDGQEITASLVDSAVYYLAGNCHIRWDDDAL